MFHVFITQRSDKLTYRNVEWSLKKSQFTTGIEKRDRLRDRQTEGTDRQRERQSLSKRHLRKKKGLTKTLRSRKSLV